MSKKQTQSLSSRLHNVLTNDHRRRNQLQLFTYAIDCIVSGVECGVTYEEAVRECVREQGVIKLLLTVKP